MCPSQVTVTRFQNRDRNRDVVLLKTDSYTGRRKTKNKWSYKNYTVLHQLGPDIPTYEIQAEGGSTRIVHWN